LARQLVTLRLGAARGSHRSRHHSAFKNNGFDGPAAAAHPAAAILVAVAASGRDLVTHLPMIENGVDFA